MIVPTRLEPVVQPPHSQRRRLALGAVAGLVILPGLAQAARITTPAQVQGPFYPPVLPLDLDNDLTVVAGRSGIAHGVVTDVAGRVLDLAGRAVGGVKLEIWQVNGYGRYHHPDDTSDRPVDPNFQGFGSTVTDRDGAYRFRTVKPLAYPGRAPHIHFALTGPGFGPFYTQMYLAGAPENATDFLLSRVHDRAARDMLLVGLAPSTLPGSALAGRFDIVLGHPLLRREP